MAWNLCHAAALEREALRINDQQPLDLIAAPIWAFDGFFALADPAIPVVTMLMTTFETIARLENLADTPYGPAVLRLEDDVLARSAFLHANSAAMAKDVDGRITGDVRVAPLGVRDHTSEFHRRRADDDRLRVLFVGRMEMRKGPDVLFEAMLPLLIEDPDLELVYVGRDTSATGFDGTYRERWMRRLRMLPGPAARIRFTGHVDEAALQQGYADADIFCAPSRFESFGLVLLEAMQYGIPVVSTHVGGIPEVVGDAGLLVPPDDVDALRRRAARVDRRCGAASPVRRSCARDGSRRLGHLTSPSTGSSGRIGTLRRRPAGEHVLLRSCVNCSVKPLSVISVRVTPGPARSPTGWCLPDIQLGWRDHAFRFNAMSQNSSCCSAR